MPFSSVLKPLAVASAIAFSTLGILSRRYQRARFYFNAIIFVTSVGVASFWGLFLTVFATATGQRLSMNYYVARSFYKICLPFVDITFDVEGEEHLDKVGTMQDGKIQSAVVIGNHQSSLDLLYLGRIFPLRTAIMAKRELKYSPVLGQFMTISGAVFVDRKNRKSALNTIQQAVDDMKRNDKSIWIFPEGTRSSKPEPELLPFKMGAFHIAIQAKLPIIPVVCENYYHLFDGRTRMDPGHLKIRILPPIPTAHLTPADVHMLADSTREMMLAALKEISLPAGAVRTSPTTSGSSSPIKASPTPPSGSEGLRKRTPVAAAPVAAEAVKPVTSRGSTEDEMDEDAVLLKRPQVA